MRGQTVVILHGRGDRWVPAKLSADYAVRARRAGARVARFTIAGGHSMLRRAHRWHTFVTTHVAPDIAGSIRRVEYHLREYVTLCLDNLETPPTSATALMTPAETRTKRSTITAPIKKMTAPPEE